jgi:hypothetical protein
MVTPLMVEHTEFMEHNMKRIDVNIDAITGEETITERDETAQEKAEREAAEAKFAAREAEAEAKELARQAIFDRLGLTADEAKLLLG